jgi:hypothetical protein
MPPTAGMMPRNIDRKGSVSWREGEGEWRGKGTGAGGAGPGEEGTWPLAARGPSAPRRLGAPATAARGPHLAQRVEGLAEPVDVAEPAKQDAHRQDHQVHLWWAGGRGETGCGERRVRRGGGEATSAPGSPRRGAGRQPKHAAGPRPPRSPAPLAAAACAPIAPLPTRCRPPPLRRRPWRGQSRSPPWSRWRRTSTRAAGPRPCRTPGGAAAGRASGGRQARVGARTMQRGRALVEGWATATWAGAQRARASWRRALRTAPCQPGGAAYAPAPMHARPARGPSTARPRCRPPGRRPRAPGARRTPPRRTRRRAACARARRGATPAPAPRAAPRPGPPAPSRRSWRLRVRQTRGAGRERAAGAGPAPLARWGGPKPLPPQPPAHPASRWCPFRGHN